MTDDPVTPFEMKPVRSSNITAMGYDSALKQSHVLFNSGDRWIYADVPEELHAEMIKASSIGSFFHKHVRGKFKGEKAGSIIPLIKSEESGL